MSTSTARRRRIPGAPAFRPRLTPIAAACSGLMFLAGAAYAQQPPADAGSKADQAADSKAQAEAKAKAKAKSDKVEAVDKLVVTGIRSSIESSVAAKRNSDSIVEVVTAEDIGKLPDVSIAESLARLPGLAAQRVSGRAQVIAIRGLSPDFAGTLLNGRQQVTSGDNRSVEYDQFPAELIYSATVYKTPDASLIGQGLSGTVDLRSIRPLEVSGRRISLNARGEWNSNDALNANTKTKGNRFSASYVDRFADNTIGVALGFAHLDTPAQDLHYKAWGFSTGEANSFCAQHPDWGCSATSGVPIGTTYLNGFEVEALSRSQKRNGAMAVVEFRPNANIHSTVDLYYSKFEKDESMRGLMGSLGDNWGGVPGAAYSNVQSTPVGNSTTFLTGATIANANMVVRNDLNTRDDRLRSAGWNTEVRIGDKWRAIADLSYSSAEREENVIETYAGIRPAYATFNASIPTAPGFPSLVPNVDYRDASRVRLSDPAGWGHDGLWKLPKAKDVIKAMRLEGKRDLDGVFGGVEFGYHRATREKTREMNELAANLRNDRAPVAVGSAFLQSPTSLAFAGIPGVVAYDVLGALGSQYDLVPQALDQIINRNYEVKETVDTAFAKLDIDTRLGSVQVRGNVGVQFVHTDQSSHGFSRLGGTVSDTTRGTTYDDVLPSLNLVFDAGRGYIARFGAAKTLARGRMDDMRAGADVSISATSHLWSGSGGNPQLEPWRAKSYDLSFEKYFGRRSYVAVAGFYKELDTYIYTKKIEYDFTGIPNTSALVPAGNIGLFERPINGSGGYVHGSEISGAFEGGLIAPMLDGFGVQASASFTSSTVHPNGPGTSQRLPGLSGTVTNAIVYYEKAGFSARVGQRYRSGFRGEITGLHNAREFTEILPDRQTDAQVGYEFTSGQLRGLSVLLQVNNLTDSPLKTKQGNGLGDAIAPLEYNKYGRQYLLGATYKF